jgi:hypothetical protein
MEKKLFYLKMEKQLKYLIETGTRTKDNILVITRITSWRYLSN